MTYHHPLGRFQSQQVAQDVLNTLGNTSEERAAKAKIAVDAAHAQHMT